METFQRDWHYLRRNHSSTVPQQLVFVDVESEATTRTVKGKRTERRSFMMGSALKTRHADENGPRSEWITFYEPGQFWAWLKKWHQKKRSVWLVATHLGRVLTLLDFWELLDIGYYRLEGNRGAASRIDHGATRGKKDWEGLFCDADPPTIILVRHGQHTLTCVDTLNYFPASIGELGLWVDRPCLPKPGDAAEQEDWQAYSNRNVQIIHDAMMGTMGWWKTNDLGNWKFTGPGLGMAAFRHRFMQHPICLEPIGPSTQLAREAIAAGECRCFFVGHATAPEEQHEGRLFPVPERSQHWCQGPVYVCDVAGFYPSMMRDNLFPVKLVAYKDPAELADVEQWQKTLCLVGRVDLKTPDVPYPCIADGERWYARGEFTTSLAGPELAAAVAAGHVVKVHALAAYAPGRLFTRFVDWFWKERQQAIASKDKLLSKFHKLIMDGLAGKFGQRSPGWVDQSDVLAVHRWGAFPRMVNGVPEPYKYRAIAGHVQRLESRHETNDSFPAIEAFINSYGRCWMAGVVAQIGAEHVLYSDCDSLHLLPEGYRRLCALGLVKANTLGKFRLEHTVRRAEYRGVKDYTRDGHHVIAGLKKCAIDLGGGAFDQEEWPSLSAILCKKPDLEIRVSRSRFTLGQSHPRAVVLMDGRTVPPLVHWGRVIAPKSAGKAHRRTAQYRRTQDGLE